MLRSLCGVAARQRQVCVHNIEEFSRHCSTSLLRDPAPGASTQPVDSCTAVIAPF